MAHQAGLGLLEAVLHGSLWGTGSLKRSFKSPWDPLRPPGNGALEAVLKVSGPSKSLPRDGALETALQGLLGFPLGTIGSDRPNQESEVRGEIAVKRRAPHQESGFGFVFVSCVRVRRGCVGGRQE